MPEEVKKRRNAELLAVQNGKLPSKRTPRAFVGRTVEVLVEGPSKTESGELGRRARPGQFDGEDVWCDRIVVFEGDDRLDRPARPGGGAGRVRAPWTLYGRAVTAEVVATIETRSG